MTKSALGRARETGVSALLFFAILGTAGRAAADDPELSSQAAAASYRWPLAYLQRPIVLLGGMTQVGVTGATFAPNHRFNVDPANGGTYQFFPAFTAGLSLGWGIADRLEIDVFAPRLICADDGNQPSNCIAVNRYNLTSAGVSYAFLRRARAQGAVTTKLEIYRSSPLELEWGADVAFKLVPWRAFGFWLEATLSRDINPPATQTSQFTNGVMNVGLDWQVTERMLLGAHAVPLGAARGSERRNSAGDLRRRLVHLRPHHPARARGRVQQRAGEPRVEPQRPWVVHPADLRPLELLTSTRRTRRSRCRRRPRRSTEYPEAWHT